MIFVSFYGFVKVAKIKGHPCGESAIGFYGMCSIFWFIFVPIYLIDLLFLLIAKNIKGDLK